MLVKKMFGLVALCGVLLIAGQARADTCVFFDDFDSDSIGRALGSLSNWTAASGNVDIHGEGDTIDWYPGNGRYVDLDGARSLATLTLSDGLFLEAGDYTLSFDLAGPGNAKKANGDSVNVQLAGINQTFQMDAGQAFQTMTLEFSVAQAGTFDLQFIAGSVADGGGMLLDDVKVTALDSAPNTVPTPMAASAGMALLGLLVARRRRR